MASSGTYNGGGALVCSILGLPPTLDPHDQVLPTDYSVRITHDSLLVPGRGEELILRLADSYELVDERVWEFRLRRGVRFASGRPLTAAAVKWNFERLRDNRRFAPSARLQTLENAEIVDPLTIRFHTRVPDMAFPRRAVQVCIADPDEAEHDGSFGPASIGRTGTGLYRVTEFEPGGHVRFERSETSWRGQAPIFAQELRPYSAKTVEQAFQDGEAHLGYVDEASAERLLAHGIDCQRRAQANVHTLRFNSMSGPFADPRLRMALSLAVDQEAIVREVYRGNGVAANQVVGADCFGFDPDLAPLRTDPDEARRLVAETRFTDTLAIDVLAPSVVLRVQGEAVARQLRAAGFRIEINYVDLDVYLAKMTRNSPRRSDLIGAGNQYGPGLDADFAFDKFSNRLVPAFVEYDNPEFQQAYDESQGEPDIERRRAKLQRCARLILDDHGCVPVWQPSLPWMVSPRIHGLDMNNCGAGWVDWLEVTME